MRRGLNESEESVTFQYCMLDFCNTQQSRTRPPPSPSPFHFPLHVFPLIFKPKIRLDVTKSSHHMRLLTRWQGWDEVY
jgi:hypothetical protein